MKTQAKIFKAIAYAYPTSSHAEKVGKGKTGCYFIELFKDDAYSREAVSESRYFDTHQEAISYADTLPQEYQPSYARRYDIANGHSERSYEEMKAYSDKAKAQADAERLSKFFDSPNVISGSPLLAR